MMRHLCFLCYLSICLSTRIIADDYEIKYAINLNAKQIGEISLNKNYSFITAIIRVKPVFFINFHQIVTTILNNDGYPVRERLETEVNKRSTSEIVEYGTDKIVHQELSKPNSKLIEYIITSPALSINSFVNRFVLGILNDYNKYPLFMVDKIIEFKIIPINERKKARYQQIVNMN